MKRIRTGMLISVCAALGAAAVYSVTFWVLSHVHWAALLGLKPFDWVSRDAAAGCIALGFLLGVSLTLGAVGGVLVGQRLDRRLAPTGGRSPNRRTA